MQSRSLGRVLHHATTQNAPFNIRCGEYDAVIAQDKATGFDPVDMKEAARALKTMADAAGSAFYLYMPWAARDNRGAQGAMTDAYQDFCRSTKSAFAPVGEVFGKLLQSEAADTLYREDGNHATPLGSYVAAVTIFYTVTGRKRIVRVSDIEDPGPQMGIPEELCQRIHTEALRTVRLFNG